MDAVLSAWRRGCRLKSFNLKTEQNRNICSGFVFQQEYSGLTQDTPCVGAHGCAPVFKTCHYDATFRAGFVGAHVCDRRKSFRVSPSGKPLSSDPTPAVRCQIRPEGRVRRGVATEGSPFREGEVPCGTPSEVPSASKKPAPRMRKGDESVDSNLCPQASFRDKVAAFEPKSI